jgi:DNA-binding response OmpR family regulator
MKKNILVAEDDHFLASAYKMKLTKAGYDVDIASDGEEAISLISKKIPDLIILDLVMPNKDGFEVLKELKGRKEWANVPVIVASNLGQKEDLDKAKSFGANEYARGGGFYFFSAVRLFDHL